MNCSYDSPQSADEKSGNLAAVRGTGIASLMMSGPVRQADVPPAGRAGEQLCGFELPVLCLLTQQMPRR